MESRKVTGNRREEVCYGHIWALWLWSSPCRGARIGEADAHRV